MDVERRVDKGAKRRVHQNFAQVWRIRCALSALQFRMTILDVNIRCKCFDSDC